jgi:hypothetical protein
MGTVCADKAQCNKPASGACTHKTKTPRCCMRLAACATWCGRACRSGTRGSWKRGKPTLASRLLPMPTQGTADQLYARYCLPCQHQHQVHPPTPSGCKLAVRTRTPPPLSVLEPAHAALTHPILTFTEPELHPTLHGCSTPQRDVVRLRPGCAQASRCHTPVPSGCKLAVQTHARPPPSESEPAGPRRACRQAHGPQIADSPSTAGSHTCDAPAHMWQLRAVEGLGTHGGGGGGGPQATRRHVIQMVRAECCVDSSRNGGCCCCM